MWSLFSGGKFVLEFVFIGAQFDVEFVLWGPVLCGVCFFGAQFDVQFDFIGPQFDVEFVFWRAVWGVPLWRNWDSGTRNQVSHTDFVQSPQPFTTDGGTLLVCLPACLPDSLTHLLSHARRKQACTWQRPSERAWLPGRGTWEKDYAEPNWRMRTCAFSRGQQMSDDDHDDVCCYSLQRVLLHTQYIYKQMRISDFLQLFPIHVRLIPSKSFCPVLPACLRARLPGAHLSFCK